MGPGYMPVLLGLLLAALALLLLATDSAGELAPVPLRPVLYVSAGLIAWALLADVAGFFPAALAQLLLSALALPRQNWRAVVVIALLLSLAAYALFVALLGMPLPAIGNL
jgi:hypothetical protein